MYKLIIMDNGIECKLTKCAFSRESGQLVTTFCSSGAPIQFKTLHEAEMCLMAIELCNNVKKDQVRVVVW